jgi:hypothetical protein
LGSAWEANKKIARAIDLGNSPRVIKRCSFHRTAATVAMLNSVAMLAWTQQNKLHLILRLRRSIRLLFPQYGP